MSDVATHARTEEEITELALAGRELLEFRNEYAPDVLTAVELVLPRKVPQVGFKIVRDGILGVGRRARASHNPPQVVVDETMYRSLREYDPVSRFDLGHEIGHLLIHKDGPLTVPKFRTSGNVTYIRLHGASSEIQADLFSRELLLPRHIVRDYTSAEELALWCKVPIKWAEQAFAKYGVGRRLPLPPAIDAILKSWKPEGGEE